jgi:periplasmic protein TonB
MSLMNAAKSTNSIQISPMAASGMLHFAIAIILALLFWTPETLFRSGKIIEVFDYPKVSTTQVVPLQVQPVPKPPPEIKKKSVFGLSRNAITENTNLPDTVAVKAGNTIAKEQDNIKLKDSDPDSLPIPTDDYLVSAMPRLKKEIRISYPEMARKQNIEGPVVMDLLIDKDGRVRNVQLVQGPGFGLNEAAVNAAKDFEFTPARVGDQNVAVKIRYTYRFVLETR